MKTTLLLFVLFTITTTSFSQIKKGQFLLGGTLHFESTKNDGTINPSYQSSDFFISPNIGFFFIDKMAAGIRIDFTSYKTTFTDMETNSRATIVSPFLRYYCLPLQKRVNAFIDVSYVHEKTKWSSLTNAGYYEKSKGYAISAGPSIFLSSQVALEFTLGYKRTLSENYDNTLIRQFFSGIGLQVHLGKINRKLKK